MHPSRLILLLCLTSSACARAGRGSCQRTADCAGGLVCVQNACVSLAEPAVQADAARSLASADPEGALVADGASPAIVSVTVRDASERPVVGARVRLSVSGEGNWITPNEAASATDGTAVFTLTTTHAETKHVTISVGDGADAITLSTEPSVTFVAGSVSLLHSSVSATPGRGLGNGKTFVAIHAVARDVFDNPVPSAQASLTASGAGNVITPATTETDANGAAAFTLSSSTSERKRISVTLADVALPLRVEFVPPWQAYNGTLSGDHCRAIAIAPYDPEEIYVGCTAGVFRSQDAGTTFAPLAGGFPSTQVNAIVVDAKTKDLVYVGTDAGVLISDGVNDWRTLDDGLPADTKVTGIAIDPASPANVFIATSKGLYLKTQASGDTWAALTSPGVLDAGQRVSDVAFDPTPDTQTLFVAATSGLVTVLPQVFSTGLEGYGMSVEDPRVAVAPLPLPGSPELVSITFAGDPPRIYVGSSDGGDNQRGVYRRSLKPTGAWEVFDQGLPNFLDDMAYIHSLVERVYAISATLLYAIAPNGAVYQRGVDDPSWTALPFAFGAAALASDRGGAGTLYAGTHFDGVYKRVGPSGAWQPIHDGLTTLWVRALALQPAPINALVVGTYGHGVYRRGSDGRFVELNTGFPDFHRFRLPALAIQSLLVDPRDSARLDVLAVSIGWAGLYYTTADHPSLWTISLAPIVSGYNDTGALSFDPTDSDKAYVCVGPSISRRTGVDFAMSTPLESVLPITRMTTSIVVDPQTPSVQYLGTDVGLFTRDDAGTGDWSLFTTGMPSATQAVAALAFDPFAPDQLYAATSAGLYRRGTSDTSWQADNAGLTSTDITALAFDPVQSGRVYLGTADGLFKRDAAGDWRPADDGLVDRAITAILIDPASPTIVYAGTRHAGVYRTQSGGE